MIALSKQRAKQDVEVKAPYDRNAAAHKKAVEYCDNMETNLDRLQNEKQEFDETRGVVKDMSRIISTYKKMYNLDFGEDNKNDLQESPSPSKRGRKSRVSRK